MPSSFTEMLAAGYGFNDPAATLGAALESSTAVHPEPKVRLPLAVMNRGAFGLLGGKPARSTIRRSRW